MKTLFAKALPYDLLLYASQPHHTARRARRAYAQTKIAFIHIPKNAGTSVETALYGQKLGHRTWREIRALAPAEFDEWEKWAIVREPTERFLSAYAYLANGGRNAWDVVFADRFIRGRTIDEFALNFPKQALRWFHFRPQVEYLLSDGKLMVDRLVTMRNLSSLPIDIKRLNQSSANKTNPLRLSKEARNSILQLYADDARLYDSVDAGTAHTSAGFSNE